MQGFSFCGIHINKLGLCYNPSKSQVFVYEQKISVDTKKVSGQNGEYWFGSTVNKKEFNLSCFFESLTEGQIKKIQTVFRRDMSGPLFFDDRPFIQYTVKSSGINIENIFDQTDGKSGTITISLVAYYPFGRANYLTIDDYDEGEDIMATLEQTTGMMINNITPSPTIETPITQNTTILLYNPGDEQADVTIRISGDFGSGCVINNVTTGQKCILGRLTASVAESKWLKIDSYSGNCVLTDGNEDINGFKYHNQGFIQLAPSCPIERDISIDYSGSMVSSEEEIFTVLDTGKSVMVDDEWIEILQVVDGHHVIVDAVFESPGQTTTNIVQMNKVIIAPYEIGGAIDISLLEFDYRPTFK